MHKHANIGEIFCASLSCWNPWLEVMLDDQVTDRKFLGHTWDTFGVPLFFFTLLSNRLNFMHKALFTLVLSLLQTQPSAVRCSNFCRWMPPNVLLLQMKFCTRGSSTGITFSFILIPYTTPIQASDHMGWSEKWYPRNPMFSRSFPIKIAKNSGYNPISGVESPLAPLWGWSPHKHRTNARHWDHAAEWSRSETLQSLEVTSDGPMLESHAGWWNKAVRLHQTSRAAL